MSGHALSTKAQRRRFTPVAITTGVLAAALLSVSMTGSLSGFVASIVNTNNTAATGVLTMQETQGATTVCNSTDSQTVSVTTAATCSAINKLGGSSTMIPGTPVVTNITIKNTGTVAAGSFTLAPGTCVQSSTAPAGNATDFCTKLQVTISANGTQFYSGNANAIPALVTIPNPPAAGASVPIVFSVVLPSTANDNAYQNLKASLPLTWTFNS